MWWGRRRNQEWLDYYMIETTVSGWGAGVDGETIEPMRTPKEKTWWEMVR